MTFAEPFWLLGLGLLVPLYLLRRSGHLGYSDHRLLGKSPAFLRLLAKLPALFFALTLVFLLLAVARPQVAGEPTQHSVEGRDIEIAVDISFSMSYPFEGTLPEHQTPQEFEFQLPMEEARTKDIGLELLRPKDSVQRIDAAQAAILQFIENRYRNKTGDRIGIIAFDSTPRYSWPLTSDLKMVYRKAQFLRAHIGTGTNFGNHEPGPIDLAVQHFKELGQAKSRALILVTDGEDYIDDEVQYRLIHLLRDNNIRFYVVGIGPTLASRDVDILRVAQAVGGRVFRVEDVDGIRTCFQTIDQLEKSAVQTGEQETRREVYPVFALLALAFFAAFLTGELFVLTR